MLQAYGARPLRRAVTAIVEDPLAEALLHRRVTAGQVAVVDRADDGLIVVRTYVGRFNMSESSLLESDVRAMLRKETHTYAD